MDHPRPTDYESNSSCVTLLTVVAGPPLPIIEWVLWQFMNILCKLGASGRTHAIALAVRRGVIYLDR